MNKEWCEAEAYLRLWESRLPVALWLGRNEVADTHSIERNLHFQLEVSTKTLGEQYNERGISGRRSGNVMQGD